MLTTRDLKNLFFQQMHSSIQKKNLTAADQAVCSFIENKSVDFESLTKFISETSSQKTPLDYLEKWRALLAYNLIVDLLECQAKHRSEIIRLTRALSQKLFWQQFQPLNILVSLNAQMTGLPQQLVTPKQLSSGAAAVEWGEHWPWADIPSLAFHAELGTLWAILGKMTNDHNLVAAAIDLATWQLNTLDANFLPFNSLFTQESDVSMTKLLSNNTILFHTISHMALRPDMQFVAEKQLEYLAKLEDSNNEDKIPFLAPLIEAWIDNIFPPLTSEKMVLDKQICDTHTALVGHRSNPYNVIATILGGHTGLGSFRFHDIHIVNYGPQHLPLGDFSGFGVEKGVSRLKDMSGINMKANEHGFSLEGRTRVASQSTRTKPAHALFRTDKSGSLWLEVKQKFNGTALTIETSFLEIKPREQLAFVFFVKASECIVNDITLQSHTLHQYNGPINKVGFQSKEAKIFLTALHGQGPMQVISLEKDKSFWGANFLVAYLLNPKQHNYSWLIK